MARVAVPVLSDISSLRRVPQKITHSPLGAWGRGSAGPAPGDQEDRVVVVSFRVTVAVDAPRSTNPAAARSVWISLRSKPR